MTITRNIQIPDTKNAITVEIELSCSELETAYREQERYYGACKELLKIIGDYDDNVLYGYIGRPDCAKFRDFKAILQDCADNKCDMIWS